MLLLIYLLLTYLTMLGARTGSETELMADDAEQKAQAGID
jgi:hypothetical protein